MFSPSGTVRVRARSKSRRISGLPYERGPSPSTDRPSRELILRHSDDAKSAMSGAHTLAATVTHPQAASKRRLCRRRQPIILFQTGSSPTGVTASPPVSQQEDSTENRPANFDAQIGHNYCTISGCTALRFGTGRAPLHASRDGKLDGLIVTKPHCKTPPLFGERLSRGSRHCFGERL